MAKKFLTTQDVADDLGIAKGTVENWRYKQQGPPWVKAVGGVRYKAADYEKWLNAQTTVAA
jgi:helix-turn-helix protein